MINGKIEMDLKGLETFGDRLMKNASKKAVRAGVKPLLQSARSNVKQYSGALKKSLTSKVDANKGEVNAWGIVGPKSKFTKQFKGRLVKPSRYAHFIEQGKYKRPFLKPAWDSRKDEAMQAIAKVIASEIERLAKTTS